MATDIVQIATGVATVIAPFAPFLVEAGKVSGKKLAEVIAEKGGEAGWEKAQQLWNKIKARIGDDPEVTSAMTMVAARPEDQTRQTMLAEVLAERLKSEPALADELLELMGGEESVQQVLADRSSFVEDVQQRMKGKGTQTVQARDESTIKNVRQIKE